MRLYYNTISPGLLDVLQKLMQEDAFAAFRLVGGTALALQLGHRISVDIDLFTDMDYGTMNLEAIADAFKRCFPHIEGLEMLDAPAPGYTIYCGNNENEVIKVDLFYTDPFLFPPITECGIRIADVRDIAAMKILAVSNATRGKDYWDIHELMAKMTLDEIINLGIQRFPYNLDREEVINRLTQAPLRINDPNIISLKGDYWEFVIEDIQEEALKLRSN